MGKMAWVLVVVGAGSAAGCVAASASPAYPPLVCDPDAAGEMVFGYQHGGAYFPYLPGEEANGMAFLFIDGSCRYWSGGRTTVMTGTLTDEELAAINAVLLTGDWPSIDQERVTGCCDGPSTALGREGIRASRYGDSPASETFVELSAIAEQWSGRLVSSGTRVAVDAPLRLEIERTAASGTAAAWPLDVPLSALVGPSERTVTAHVFEGTDAATLRELASSQLTDGTLQVRVVAIDVVPFADDRGCLRPLGSLGSSCRL